MRVTLDRRHCTRWQGACESCFASHLEHGDFDTADCGMNIVEDGRKTVDFKITDRDGSFKRLTITPRNQAEAIDSWLLLWQRQAGASA